MVLRVWRGWTTPENAEAYEQLLRNEIFPGIARKNVAGYRGIQLLRRAIGEEVEFMTIMEFDALESVKAFAGPEYETAYVPETARKVLARFDPTSAHYELRADERAHPETP